jgi:hypothetical protein
MDVPFYMGRIMVYAVLKSLLVAFTQHSKKNRGNGEFGTA